MADTINKPSIQIRSGLPSPLADKSPSPATKLLISHGKPNFTIARSNSTSSRDNANNPLSSPQPTANNNYNAYKSAGSTASNYNSNNKNISNGHSSSSNSNSDKFVVGTKFNGVFKPSPAAASWAGSNGNGNEAAQVVLRRPKLITQEEPQPAGQEDDANVPEFIRRQRRIQERLAKENVLDFENRRSGYFTHVMISPDSPNRTSFVETMASPAIVPALEMPLPAKIEEEEPAKPATNGHSEAVSNGDSEAGTNGHSNGHSEQQQQQVEQAAVQSNGHSQQEDVAAEEVAKAIEEVNKAVAGEDDDSKPEVEEVKPAESEPVAVQAPVEVVATVAIIEPETTPAAEQNGHSSEEAITISHTNGHAKEETNGHANGHSNEQTNGHSNGHSEEPSLPTPDPSGALGVNYEPKTVVSFSQELGGGENNYPDTVKVTKEAEPKTPAEAELQELAKLKFDIKNDAQNEVQVTPVLRAE